MQRAMRKNRALVTLLALALVLFMQGTGLVFAGEVSATSDAQAAVSEADAGAPAASDTGADEPATPEANPAAQAAPPEADASDSAPPPAPTDPAASPLDAASDAQTLAATINSGVAGALVSATASGSTVTVTTRATSNTALPLTINIPAGVTVVWQAQYRNSNLVATDSTDTNTFFISVTGAGTFIVADGADINVTASSPDDAFFRALSVNGPDLQITGGSITVTTTTTMAVIAVSTNYTERITISGGTISLSGPGRARGGEDWFGGILVNHGSSPVLVVTGGSISVNVGTGGAFGILQMQSQSDKGTVMYQGGTIDISSAGTDARSGAVGIMAETVDVQGGRIHAKGGSTTEGVRVEDSLTIGSGAAIFAEGPNAATYAGGTGTTDIAPGFVNTQATALSGYAASVAVGASLRLTPAQTPEPTPGQVLSKTYQWTSSDPSVVTVDANGFVVGVSDGVATITAKALDFTGLEATFDIKVGTGISGGSGSGSGGGLPATGDSTSSVWPVAVVLLFAAAESLIFAAILLRQKRRTCEGEPRRSPSVSL